MCSEFAVTDLSVQPHLSGVSLDANAAERRAVDHMIVTLAIISCNLDRTWAYLQCPYAYWTERLRAVITVPLSRRVGRDRIVRYGKSTVYWKVQ